MEVASHVLHTVYKYKFLSEPGDALKCLVCLDVAEEPWQHSKCGRLFCSECLDRHGRDKPCPNCRRENPQYFEDSRGKSVQQEKGGHIVIRENPLYIISFIQYN